MPDLCTLSGTIVDPAGLPFGDAQITLRPRPGLRTTETGLIVAPIVPALVATDAEGQVALSLAPGYYTGQASRGQGGASFTFDLAVPDLPEAPLADYIGAIDLVVQTSAQLARDQAVQAVQDATDQVALAQVQVALAAGQVTLAQGAAGGAATERSAAETAARAADVSRTGAEAARDAAMTGALTYTTLAAGLAATADGGQFNVALADNLVRYQRSGAAGVEIARYPTQSGVTAQDAEVAYYAGLGTYTLAMAAGAEQAPSLVDDLGHVLAWAPIVGASETAQAEAAYYNGIGSYTLSWAGDAAQAPIIVAATGEVIFTASTVKDAVPDTYKLSEDLYYLGLGNYTMSWAGSAETAPLIVTVTGEVILSASGGGSTGGLSDMEVMLGLGQSTMEGEAGVDAANVYGTELSHMLNTLRRGAAADIHLGLTTSGGDSIQLDAAAFDSIGPYTPMLTDASHGTTPLEGMARAGLAQGYGPFLLAAMSEGGQTIANLSPGAPAGFYAWDNLVAAVTRMRELADAAGAKLRMLWVPICQGEGDTHNAALGAAQDALRLDLEALVQGVFGQTEGLAMIAFANSSFSDPTGCFSIFDYAKNSANWDTYVLAGPTYQYGWTVVPDSPTNRYLHHTSREYAEMGNMLQAVRRRVESNGYWLPLHMVSASRTDATTITVKLSEPAMVNASDPIVLPIANLGISLVGGTIAGVTLSWDTLTITTTGSNASVTAIRAAANIQSNPRTAENVPRTNICALASLGRSLTDGKLLRNWMTHQELVL